MPVLLVFSASSLASTLPSLSRSHIITIFLCQVFGSLQSLSAHRAPVRGVMAEWLEALLLLWHCEHTTSEVLPFPASMGSSQGRRNDGVLLLGDDWRSEYAEKDGLLGASCRRNWPSPAGWPTDSPPGPSCGENPNKWIRKETASYLSLRGGLARSGVVLVHQAGARTLRVLPEETWEWATKQLTCIYKHKFSTREISSTIVISYYAAHLRSWLSCSTSVLKLRVAQDLLNWLFQSQYDIFFMR